MVAVVPPVPALVTTQDGMGWGSWRICSKMDSAMLLFARQSVDRSENVNWSMKWPLSCRARSSDTP